jgi:hypothetical protein
MVREALSLRRPGRTWEKSEAGVRKKAQSQDLERLREFFTIYRRPIQSSDLFFYSS